MVVKKKRIAESLALLSKARPASMPISGAKIPNTRDDIHLVSKSQSFGMLPQPSTLYRSPLTVTKAKLWYRHAPKAGVAPPGSSNSTNSHHETDPTERATAVKAKVVQRQMRALSSDAGAAEGRSERRIRRERESKQGQNDARLFSGYPSLVTTTCYVLGFHFLLLWFRKERSA